MHRSLAPLLALLALVACRSQSVGAGGPHGSLEVVVIGTIHSEHLTNPEYSLQVLERWLRAIDPDAVLTEIPPDRFDQAAREFRESGAIAEPRVSRFPEYTQVLFPLQVQLGFAIVPCAGWTAEMAAERSRLLAEWRTTRPEDTALVDSAEEGIAPRVAALGLGEGPLALHDPRYDDIVRTGLGPYQDLFGDDLGPGGWDNINKSHWALISAALDRLIEQGQARRVAITFGAWHKYWILDRLRERPDVVVLDPRDFLPGALPR